MAQHGEVVAISWVGKREIRGLVGRPGAQAPSPSRLAKVPRGRVVYHRVRRIERGGPEVEFIVEKRKRYRAYLRAPRLRRESRAFRRRAKKLRQVIVVWQPGGGAHLFEVGRLGDVYASASGGRLTRTGHRASVAFGALGSITTVAYWTADKATGLRVFRTVAGSSEGLLGIGVVGGSTPVPKQDDAARGHIEVALELWQKRDFEGAGDAFFRAAAVWNLVADESPYRRAVDGFIRNTCKMAASAYVSGGADALLLQSIRSLRSGNRPCAAGVRESLRRRYGRRGPK